MIEKAPIPQEFTGNEREFARSTARHRHIIEANRDALAGKRVLDLASYNGRWSYAALKAGAASAVGVEVRQESIDKAQALFTRHDMQNYQFVCADIFDWLTTCPPETFDTILCPGVYYHILDHYRLFTLMARLKPNVIIIDSGFVRSFRNCIYVKAEDPKSFKNAAPKFAGQRRELVGLVSLGLMIQMAWNNGYSCRPVVWRAGDFAEGGQPVKDYLHGRRFTLRFEPMQGREDSGWQEAWRQALTAINPKWEKMLAIETHDSVADPLQSSNSEFSVLAQPEQERQERIAPVGA